jgi:hypothetical protein
MNKTATLEELTSFTQTEQVLLKNLNLVNEVEVKPSKKSVEFILNYSKCYSSRKSKLIKSINTVLN